jgi:VanZ family protein
MTGNSSVFDQPWYRALAWAAVLAYMGLIFWLSSRTTEPLPMWFPQQDKLYHFLGYNVLGFLIAHATAKGSHKKRFWIAFALASVYGITDELHQSFVPGRDCSFWDWLADTAGAWGGAYLYLKSETVLTRAKR